jgi:hypothetical protein
LALTGTGGYAVEFQFSGSPVFGKHGGLLLAKWGEFVVVFLEERGLGVAYEVEEGHGWFTRFARAALVNQEPGSAARRYKGLLGAFEKSGGSLASSYAHGDHAVACLSARHFVG